ncbi:MAG: hypothetical protein R3F40_04025 [Candidatus Competibacteraceae bacterium]
MQEYRDYARVDEGTLTGISTRFAFKILSQVFNFDHIEVAANPVHLLYVLERQIEREQFPAKPRSDISPTSKVTWRRATPNSSARNFQQAYLESYSEYGQNIFDRYVTYADFWIQDQEYHPIPTPANRSIGQHSNAELGRSRNRPASAAKDFRNEIVNFVLRARASNADAIPPGPAKSCAR